MISKAKLIAVNVSGKLIIDVQDNECALMMMMMLTRHRKFKGDSVPFTFYLFIPVNNRKYKENPHTRCVIAVLLDLI